MSPLSGPQPSVSPPSPSGNVDHLTLEAFGSVSRLCDTSTQFRSWPCRYLPTLVNGSTTLPLTTIGFHTVHPCSCAPFHGLPRSMRVTRIRIW
jgi:hypothetical protein